MSNEAVWRQLEERRPLPLRWLLLPSQRLHPASAKHAGRGKSSDAGRKPQLTAVFSVVDRSLASRSLLLVRTLDASPGQSYVSLTAMCLYARLSPVHIALALELSQRRTAGGDEEWCFETESALLGAQPQACRGELWVKLTVAKKLAKLLGVENELGALLSAHKGTCSLDEGDSRGVLHK